MFFLKGCAFYVALLCCSALAQDSRGTIGGRISDPQDGAIPGVKVVVTNIDTGVNTSLVTNEKGVYVAPLLIPGNYQVSVEHQGFKRATRSNITLSVSDDLQIDLRLELGNVSDSI